MRSLTQVKDRDDWRAEARKLHEEVREFEGYPESFRFTKAGDQLTGRILGYDTGISSFGESFIATIQDLDGKVWSLWLFHAVLLSKFNELSPKPGDVISIKRLPEIEDKGYVPYLVRMVGDQRPPDFAKFLPADLKQRALQEAKAETETGDALEVEIGDDDIPF